MRRYLLHYESSDFRCASLVYQLWSCLAKLSSALSVSVGGVVTAERVGSDGAVVQTAGGPIWVPGRGRSRRLCGRRSRLVSSFDVTQPEGHSPLASRIWIRWASRFRSVAVWRCLPSTSAQDSNGRLEVTMRLVRTYAWLRTSKNSSAQALEKGI